MSELKPGEVQAQAQEIFDKALSKTGAYDGRVELHSDSYNYELKDRLRIAGAVMGIAYDRCRNKGVSLHDDNVLAGLRCLVTVLSSGPFINRIKFIIAKNREYNSLKILLALNAVMLYVAATERPNDAALSLSGRPSQDIEPDDPREDSSCCIEILASVLQSAKSRKDMTEFQKDVQQLLEIVCDINPSLGRRVLYYDSEGVLRRHECITYLAVPIYRLDTLQRACSRVILDALDALGSEHESSLNKINVPQSIRDIVLRSKTMGNKKIIAHQYTDDIEPSLLFKTAAYELNLAETTSPNGPSTLMDIDEVILEHRVIPNR
jgi:hypothetical protein